MVYIFIFVYSLIIDLQPFRMASELKLAQNQPNISHWSFENGYDDTVSESDYPFRVFNAKEKTALLIMSRVFEEDLDYLCRGTHQGFKVILHTPGQALKMSRHSFRVPLSDDVMISIKPKLITTSDELRRYPPKQRQCYFDSERQLGFFKIYTQHNCEVECLSNFTATECGCVKFSMPSKQSFVQSDQVGHWIVNFHWKFFFSCIRGSKYKSLWGGKYKLLSRCWKETVRRRYHRWTAKSNGQIVPARMRLLTIVYFYNLRREYWPDQVTLASHNEIL